MSKKFKALQTLVERGLITQDVFNEAMKYLAGNKSFYSKYGKEIEIKNLETGYEVTGSEIDELLNDNILVKSNGVIYALPLKLESDNKELKLYYRSIETI